MKTYAEEVQDILPVHQDVFKSICRVVEKLPSGLDCHQVCEALTHLSFRSMYLSQERGYFGYPGAEHSWLFFVNNPNVIIDPYPWASAGSPLLLTLEGVLNPWRFLYRKNRELPVFLQAVSLRSSAVLFNPDFFARLQPGSLTQLVCGLDYYLELSFQFFLGKTVFGSLRKHTGANPGNWSEVGPQLLWREDSFYLFPGVLTSLKG
jgi:hypothetical protein